MREKLPTILANLLALFCITNFNSTAKAANFSCSSFLETGLQTTSCIQYSNWTRAVHSRGIPISNFPREAILKEYQWVFLDYHRKT